MQLSQKSQNKTICSCSHNNNHKTKINKDKDTSSWLNNFCKQINIKLLSNDNIKEATFGD